MSVIEREEIAQPTAAPVSKADIFNRAADLLEEFGWCQFAPARDEDDWATVPCDPAARSFCLTGSIERATFDLTGIDPRQDGWPTWMKVRTEPKLPGERPRFDPLWNNQPERTRAEVVARLREAASDAA